MPLRNRARKWCFSGIPKAQLYYAAGLLEGEGSFLAIMDKKNTPRFYLQARMTDPEPLNFLWAIFGGKIYGPYREGKANLKPIYSWRMMRLDGCVEIMRKLLPMMSARRGAQIQHVLNMAKKYPPRRKIDRAFGW